MITRPQQLHNALQNRPIWYVIARKDRVLPKRRHAYEPFKDHGFVCGGSASQLPSQLKMNTWNFDNKDPETFSKNVKDAKTNAKCLCGCGEVICSSASYTKGSHSSKAPSLFKRFYKIMKEGDVMFVANPEDDQFLVGLVQSPVKFTTKLNCGDFKEGNLIHYRDCDWIVECRLTELGKGTDGRKYSLGAQQCRAAMMASPATIGPIFSKPNKDRKFNNPKNFYYPNYWRKELQRMLNVDSTDVLGTVDVTSQLTNERPALLSEEIFVPIASNDDKDVNESNRKSRRTRRSGGGNSSSSSSSSSSKNNSSSSSSSSSSRRNKSSISSKNMNSSSTNNTSTNTNTNSSNHTRRRSTRSRSSSSSITGIKKSSKPRKVKVQILTRSDEFKTKQLTFYPGTTEGEVGQNNKLRIYWCDGSEPSYEKRESVYDIGTREWKKLYAEMYEDDEIEEEIEMTAYELARLKQIQENKAALALLPTLEDIKNTRVRNEKRKRT